MSGRLWKLSRFGISLKPTLLFFSKHMHSPPKKKNTKRFFYTCLKKCRHPPPQKKKKNNLYFPLFALRLAFWSSWASGCHVRFPQNAHQQAPPPSRGLKHRPRCLPFGDFGKEFDPKKPHDSRKINMVHLKLIQLKCKIIWTKPPWLWVPAVNFPGSTIPGPKPELSTTSLVLTVGFKKKNLGRLIFLSGKGMVLQFGRGTHR